MTEQPIPANWEIDDPETWSLTTTVDACAGVHHTGAIAREHQEIRHAALDYEHAAEIERSSGGTPEGMRDQAQWWFDVLTPIHDATCALAEAKPDEIDACLMRLGMPTEQRPDGAYPSPWECEGDVNDLEHEALVAERIIAALTEEPAG